MDLKTLRLFLALAHTQHFGKASAQMHVSPSTLSRTIARLEEEVGSVLFERDNRSVRLTEAGRRTRESCERIIHEWSILQSDLHQQPHTLRGQIRLYCSVTASYSLLIDLLQDFRPRYPQIEVVVDTGDAAHAVEAVVQDETDIAIAPRPDQLPSAVSFRAFATSPLCFIGPVIPCPVRTQLSEQDIAWGTVPFVVAEHGLARQRLYEWFAQRNLRPTVYAQVGGHEAIVSMVALGLGVGVVPQLVLDHSPMREQIAVLPVTPPLAPFVIGLCALKRRLQDPVAQAFWQICPEQP